MVYRHLVLFRMREHATDEHRIEARRLLDELGDEGHEHPGLLRFRVEESLDERKGRVLIEEATFATREDFDAFRASDVHRRTTARMAQLADWFVGDYESDGAEDA